MQDGGAVLLAVDDISLSFGGVNALSNVSFDIRDGEIRWSFKSKAGGHHPSLATLVDEARKAVA